MIRAWKKLWRRTRVGHDGRPSGPLPPLALANAARDRGDWEEAARLYGDLLAATPRLASIHVQRGHVLREAGHLQEAFAAYRAATGLDANHADAWVHLAHLARRLGRTEAAIEAFSALLSVEGYGDEASSALIELGARDRLPTSDRDRRAVGQKLSHLGSDLRRLADDTARLVSVSTFPVEAYGALRDAYPVQRPLLAPVPAPLPGLSLLILVDGRDADPSAIRKTVISLLDQSDVAWAVVVEVTVETLGHPVAGLAEQDDRITFVPVDPNAGTRFRPAPGERSTLLVDAGAVFDPEAVGWLRYASQRHPGFYIMTDHDHFTDHWREGRHRSEPVLQPMPGRYDMASTPYPPALLMIAPGGLSDRHSVGGVFGAEMRRTLALSALRQSRLAHLPRALVSVPLEKALSAQPANRPLPDHNDDSTTTIMVVIPTRDEAAMLQACIDSLTTLAKHPERLTFVIADNRSRDETTHRFLTELASSPQQTVLTMDEPFNWSRLNNRCLAGRAEEIVVFANNDVEMLTRDWDVRLTALLADDDVGVVGARLLYPDGSIQHGGLMLDVNKGRPVHEGLHALADDAGPLDRWVRCREAAAVTGAFMALRTATFAAAGGFDEQLAVAYNDLDLCMRVRGSGKSVLYDGEIVLTHHESKTRGLNDTPERVRWDDAELKTLHDIWGPAIFAEPSRNPQWVSAHVRPFDGVRDISVRQTIDYLDWSACPSPWNVQLASTVDTGPPVRHLGPDTPSRIR